MMQILHHLVYPVIQLIVSTCFSISYGQLRSSPKPTGGNRESGIFQLLNFIFSKIRESGPLVSEILQLSTLADDFSGHNVYLEKLEVRTPIHTEKLLL